MGRIEAAPRAAPPAWWEEMLEDARDWCRGRMWLPRALLLAYLAYAEVRFLANPLSSTMFSGITLAVHELGHVVFGFLGHFVSALMGSGTQVLVPLVVMVVFLRQADYFGVSVGGFWLSFSLFELANYVADARARQLPLVGLSDDPEHDWHYLLSTLHLLPLDTTFAFLLRAGATVVGAASFAFAVWLLLTMARARRPLG